MQNGITRSQWVKTSLCRVDFFYSATDFIFLFVTGIYFSYIIKYYFEKLLQCTKYCHVKKHTMGGWTPWIPMMTSSSRKIFRVADLLWVESTCHPWFPSQRPVMRNFDVFLRCAPEQTMGLPMIWYTMMSIWRHCNGSCVVHEKPRAANFYYHR